MSYVVIRGNFVKKIFCHDFATNFRAFLVVFGQFTKNKKPVNDSFTGFCSFLMTLIAVREGFEPSVQLPVRQFSKLILSASQAPHQVLKIKSLFSGLQI